MIPQAYLYICDGDIDNPVLTHKKMDWPEKYSHWQEIPLVMAEQASPVMTSLKDLKQEVCNAVGEAHFAPRQWVVPTRNEILEIVNKFYKQNASEREIAFARLVIAKLKEKNT